MRKQSGITLIALVISIIVMLILAGVSINAIVGENGVLSRAQYTNFMSEMSAVEESVQLWKAGELMESKGQSNTAIPTNGLCKVNDLTGTERLIGEIGYYRTWSIGKNMPDMNILSSAEDFNKKYEGEFIFYPAGVQDLYYLNNEALELDKDKIYLIDAATSIVYSTTGITLNGVRCYSTSMAKAVMGNNVAPIFAEAEVSGTGTGDKLAGNVSSEYLVDENGEYILDADGNKIKNEDYNPYGFKIISDRSNNLYKLYNNGDLYAKGIKGIEMNTPQSEMQLIDQYSFTAWSVEENMSEVGSYKEIIQGYQTMFVIDSKDNLWAVGSNNSNKLGLTEEQQIEYTGREAIKLNIDNKGVSKVFSGGEMTFVITTDNNLYVAGWNDYGQSGLGHKNVIYSFSKVEFFSQEQVKKITRIYANCSNDGKYVIVRIGNDENQEFYFVGKDSFGSIGNGKTQILENFTRIWNGTIGDDIDQDIKEIVARGAAIDILKNDGTLWHAGYRAYDGGPGGESLSGGSNYVLQKFEPSVFGCTSDAEVNIVEIYESAGIIVVRENADGTKEYWGAAGSSSNLGLLTEIKTSKYEKITFPDEMFANNDSIKELYPINENVYYLMNSGKVWASGSIVGLGKTSSDKEKPNWIVCITKESNNTMTLPLIESVSQYKKDYNNSASNTGTVLFKGKDGQIYTTGNSAIMYGNNILQSSWVKINPKENGEYIKIKSFKPNLIIDDNNNLWVAGNDARYLGLGEDSPRVVNNYEKITDSNVVGKVKEAYLGEYTIAVLTTENKLYVSGVYSHAELYGEYCFPGWSSNDENSYTFKEITSLSNIKQLSYRGYSRFAICEENDELVAYAWGRSFAWTPYSQIPKIVSTINAVDIKKADAYGRCSFIITNNNKLYVAGDIAAEIGMSSAKTTLTEHTYFADKEVKEVVVGSSGTKIVLTTDGKVYGWGVMNKLGIGSTSTAMKNLPEYLGLDNVEQIVAGNGWLVAIKNDGTVWGTGTNQYGILGRWIGIDRNSPNSRYKTAFDWVECPELEI